MTTASKRSLHPEVIKRIGRLEIRARHIVEGLLSGMHRSPYFGQIVSSSFNTASTPPATTCAASIGKSGPSRTGCT